MTTDLPSLSTLPGCTALDAARGLARHCALRGETLLCEVPLPNGRRVDALGLDARGQVTIYEIKVARADLLGDAKWTDYLPWCDRFFWVVTPHIDAALLDAPERLPDRTGVIVADRYDALIMRDAALEPLAPARRRAELLRISRIAMARMMRVADPDWVGHGLDGELSR
jgi:hypothetical protein